MGWFRQCASNPVGVNILAGFWSRFILAHRTTLHPVQDVALTLWVRWTDGRICPLRVYLDQAHTINNQITDGIVAWLVTNHAHDLAREVMLRGLDALHEPEPNKVITNGTDATVQALLRALNGAVYENPQQRNDVLGLGLFFAQTLSSPVPPPK